MTAEIGSWVGVVLISSVIPLNPGVKGITMLGSN
jgi:hypothetical protein